MPQAPPAYLRVAARIRERIGTRELPTGTRLLAATRRYAGGAWGMSNLLGWPPE